MGVTLTRVEIKNFRSIFDEPGFPRLSLSLTEGMNAIIGPNNCGKSNILKALALALEEPHDSSFVPERDTPSPRLWARPTITLDFLVRRSSGPERTLLRRLEDYELSALHGEKKSTLASKGRLRLRVQYTKSGRDDFFLTAAGGRRGTPELNRAALDQFRKVLRFVLVRSGEDISTFLAGRFNDILHTVLRENLATEVGKAEERRAKYQRGVAESVFGPVSELAQREISEMIPEISQVRFDPRVLGIDETLANAGITLVDAAETSIGEKGTGVRGTLLLAILRYIAEHSRRSIVFAIEEPEAFLHPGVQQGIRDDLEAVSELANVTLMITTHSPFVVSRSPAAQVIVIGKDAKGRTYLVDSCPGDQDLTHALSSLFNETVTPDYLERAAHLDPNARAVVVVEGYTDARFLELGAQLCGNEDAAEGVELVPAGGARAATAQAVVLASAVRVPVFVLLDYEELTKPYLKMLTDTFGFDGRQVLTYRPWGLKPAGGDPAEAEDLFPQKLLTAFVQEVGENSVVTEKVRVDGAWHFGFSQPGKAQFLEYLARVAKPDDFAKFGEIWTEIGGRIAALSETGPTQ